MRAVKHLVLAAGFALTGCVLNDPPPTQDELVDLLEKETYRVVETLNAYHCERAGEGRYLCGFEVTYIGFYPDYGSECFHKIHNEWKHAETSVCLYG